MTTITLILPDSIPVLELARFAVRQGCLLFHHTDDTWELRPGTVRRVPPETGANVLPFPLEPKLPAKTINLTLDPNGIYTGTAIDPLLKSVEDGPTDPAA